MSSRLTGGLSDRRARRRRRRSPRKLPASSWRISSFRGVEVSGTTAGRDARSVSVRSIPCAVVSLTAEAGQVLGTAGDQAVAALMVGGRDSSDDRWAASMAAVAAAALVASCWYLAAASSAALVLLFARRRIARGCSSGCGATEVSTALLLLELSPGDSERALALSFSVLGVGVRAERSNAAVDDKSAE